MSVSSFAPSLNNGHDSPIITSSSSSSSHPIMSHHSHEFPMFRSETMSMIRIIMTDDIAVDTMRELGHMGKVHLIDQTTKQTVLSDHSLYYKKRVALCGYWERKLDSFKDAMREFDVEIPGPEIIPVERRYGDVVDAIKNYLEPLESSLGKNILFRRQHYQLINEYIERQWVLQLCYDREISGAHGRDRARAEDMNDGSSSESGYGSFDQDQTALLASDNEMKGSVELEEARQRAGNFSSSISGVVPVDRQPFFERMLFRVSRGNVLSRFTPIDVDVVDPATAIPMRKAVFTVIFMGQQMKRRISKIIQYFGATEYDVPTSTRDYLLQQREIVDRLKEYRMILNRTDQEIHEMLSAMAFNRDQPDISPLIDWYAAIRKEKGVCDALRKCEVEGATSKMLTVTGWIPAENLDELNFYLERAVRETKLQKAAVNIISPRGMPPTYIRTNKFTSSYQTIVDTYGVPRYKEVNPGLFTIITFPFLFGVMYGDIGHGMGLTLFAMFMIWKERQYDEQLRRGNMNEIFGMAYGGRYMLLLMGMFAVYVGFIYNDCVSIPLRLFDTTWYHKKNDPVAVSTGQVYPFGVDPSWYHTENELAFFNSMKMKMSVTLGVIQMSFGIFLSLLNHLYNHDRVSVWFEFIPRIIFMLSVFGYMIFLIFIKWIIDWNKRSIQPPSLVQTMIAMFLQPGTVDEDKQIFPGQASIQVLLLLAAFISVPFMLLGPPLASRAQFRKKYGKGYKPVPVHHDDDDEDVENSYSHDDEKTDESSEELIHKTRVKRAPVHEHVMEEEEEVGHGHGTVGPHYNFNDHLITQGIHTIEFVLGAVSNTASYLRLWALSLAHAELAGVFWSKMVMQYGIDTGNAYMVFTGVAVWAMASFAVLLCMDVLECFLHALRLHWVEFQNKFFAADGYAFEPFSFENITKED